MRKIGALEAGGTKMVMAVYDEDGRRLSLEKIPTEAPEITIPRMKKYFEENRIDALGIGSFGPLDLDPASETYGWITSTPKPGWRNVPLAAELTAEKKIPFRIDTDVNVAALAEVREGAAIGCQNAVYVTIGTGIGGGVVLNGRPVHGLVHPELGHMLMRPVEGDPDPRGVCPYHDGCLEGLASGPALTHRAGKDASELPDGDPVFRLEEQYLAQMCANLVLCFSPEKIILGGGVMGRRGMMEGIRKETERLLGGYVQHPMIQSRIEDLIVTPALWPLSGLEGSRILGMEALKEL